ncbi:hypothetical protein C8J56DRAFT_953182 [Mycena floridula]|nr:hypothetical protein C8J56DRAFT_953182 [Mycena floridula]
MVHVQKRLLSQLGQKPLLSCPQSIPKTVFSQGLASQTGQKRLASQLASASTSHIKQFPPKVLVAGSGKASDAKGKPSAQGKPETLDAETWAELQPAPSSALSAFAHRVGLGGVLGEDGKTLLQLFTHPSFLPFHQTHLPHLPVPLSNGHWETLGNGLMGMFAAEHIHVTHPFLPTRVFKAAVTAHVGGLACASVAREMGAGGGGMVRWRRGPRTPPSPPLLHSDALASIPRALTALIYQRKSLTAAREFVERYFLSRQVDFASMLKFRDPKTALLEMVDKFGREKPKSRLLKETGRYSNSPIFVVGIYSGEDKLGEGFGSSLKMAEFRAAEDALHRVYLTKTPKHLVQVPTSTFPSTPNSVFPPSRKTSTFDEPTYLAPDLPAAEIMYASSGRSWVTRVEA